MLLSVVAPFDISLCFSVDLNFEIITSCNNSRKLKSIPGTSCSLIGWAEPISENLISDNYNCPTVCVNRNNLRLKLAVAPGGALTWRQSPEPDDFLISSLTTHCWWELCDLNLSQVGKYWNKTRAQAARWREWSDYLHLNTTLSNNQIWIEIMVQKSKCEISQKQDTVTSPETFFLKIKNQMSKKKSQMGFKCVLLY